MVNPRIILATGSVQRHKLAKQMGFDFEIFPSSYEEDITLNLSPDKLVMALAEGKAADVAKRFDDGIVIGMDTIVYHERKVLGKPKSEEDAFSMLKSYSNGTHEVYSGICLIDIKSKKVVNDFEITKVKFSKMDDNEIKKYIATGEPMGKAGAYGAQGSSFVFIEKVDGCFFNVIGFPVRKVYENLKKFGVNFFDVK